MAGEEKEQKQSPRTGAADAEGPDARGAAREEGPAARGTDSEEGPAVRGAAGLRRLHLVFEGQVQGVGFRWTSQIKARKVGCTGWVHNERDGSVTMELQGTDDQIARFFGEFGRAYARYPIDYVIADKDDIEPVEGETDFVVRLYRY